MSRGAQAARATRLASLVLAETTESKWGSISPVAKWKESSLSQSLGKNADSKEILPEDNAKYSIYPISINS
ncbi:hypothetical protein SAY87_019802 [Trapa incisa]|uniref:Uncharacterized protein n=1 Tax=Trapa incisa TaxID=236973 RepID=A0AAN7K2G1_9MYRT|nr:hypothetical protein SAY87_019802 [Trapa incisa]